MLTYLAPSVFNSFSSEGEFERMVAQYVQYGAGSKEQVTGFLNNAFPHLEMVAFCIVLRTSAVVIRSRNCSLI